MKRFRLWIVLTPIAAATAAAIALSYIYLRRLLLAMLGAGGSVETLLASDQEALALSGERALAAAGYANTGVSVLMDRSGFAVLTVMIVTMFLASALIVAAYLYNYRKRFNAECAQLIDCAVSRQTPGKLTLESLDRLKKALQIRFDEDAGAIAHLEKEQERYVRFLHDICHQLKTPLTTMAVELELIKRENDSEHILRCENQIERASELISTLLRGGQFESGAVKLNWTRASLYLLFDDVAEELKSLASEKGAGIVVTGDEDAYSTFDERWMREAVENILKNCIEHAAAGSEIKCIVYSDDVHYGFVIESSGAHLPEDRDVFELYESGGTGTGIGLNLAKHIISAHFGRLTAENTEYGCRFIAEAPQFLRFDSAGR